MEKYDRVIFKGRPYNYVYNSERGCSHCCFYKDCLGVGDEFASFYSDEYKFCATMKNRFTYFHFEKISIEYLLESIKD